MGHASGRPERRRSERIPVSLGFKLNVRGEQPEFFYTTEIVNFSEGGICMVWDFCEGCSGYAEGAIHPDCVFGDYDYRSPDSGELTFHVELANYGKDINFRGKAVYTLKQGDSERVGIAFTSISDEMKEFMNRLV